MDQEEYEFNPNIITILSIVVISFFIIKYLAVLILSVFGESMIAVFFTLLSWAGVPIILYYTTKYIAIKIL